MLRRVGREHAGDQRLEVDGPRHRARAPGGPSAARGSDGAFTPGTLAGGSADARPAASLAPMRRTLTACRSGLSVAAAVVLLAACGGVGRRLGVRDVDELVAARARSETDERRARPTSAFCAEARGLLGERSTPAVTGEPTIRPRSRRPCSRPPPTLRRSSRPRRSPTDWNALADGTRPDRAGRCRRGDPTTPASAAQFLQTQGPAGRRSSPGPRRPCRPTWRGVRPRPPGRRHRPAEPTCNGPPLIPEVAGRSCGSGERLSRRSRRGTRRGC